MLALARGKGVRQLIAADAAQLPLAEQSFDAITVAFGLRNVRDWAAALREMRRVLTSAGHLLVLDFSLPPKPILRFLYRFYLRRILPLASALITREKEAYQYLGASIENFPSGRAMCDLIEASGFQNAIAEPLTGGIVTIYTAEGSSARLERHLGTSARRSSRQLASVQGVGAVIRAKSRPRATHLPRVKVMAVAPALLATPSSPSC